MARVKMDDIVEDLRSDFRAIFREVVQEAKLDVDPERLYGIFNRIAQRKLGWESVSDNYVETR